MGEKRNIVLRDVAVRAAVVFAVSRIFVFAVAYCWLYFGGTHYEPGVREPIWHGDSGGHGYAAEPWRRWDALWFMKTAREGYVFRAGAQSNTSVLPLYPALMGAVSRGGIDIVWAGVIVSNVCLFAAVFFMLLIVDVRAPGFGMRAAWALVLFPCAFVLSGVYSESLFLACVLGSMYFAGAGRWAFAGLLGMCAALTRFAGVALVLPLAVCAWQCVKDRRGGWGGFLWILLVPAGTFLFFVYLQAATGSFTNYFNAQAHWQKGVSWPWVGLGWELIPWIWEPNRILNVGSVVLFSALTVNVWKKYGAVWGSYMLAGLVVPMCASRWIGMPRYVLVLWPGFVAIAVLIKPRWLYWCYIAVSCVGMVWLFREFAEWRISL